MTVASKVVAVSAYPLRLSMRFCIFADVWLRYLRACVVSGVANASGEPRHSNGGEMVDDHTVLGRAVAILDCVVDAVDPLPLAVLTRLTTIPKPTVRRIANHLVDRGMLELTPDGYVPGQRLIHHGLQSAFHDGTVVTVQPHLQDLHLRTRGEAAWFARMHQGELVVTGAAYGRQHIAELHKAWFSRMSRLGPSMILLAMGIIEVANRPDLADRILFSGWPPLTRYSITDKGRMRRVLAEAFDTGFAQEVEQTKLGVACVAAALRDSSGQLVGAIGATGQCRAIGTSGVRAGLERSAELLERELRSATTSFGTEVWNVPTFDRRTGIGYTWPTMDDSPPAIPLGSGSAGSGESPVPQGCSAATPAAVARSR